MPSAKRVEKTDRADSEAGSPGEKYPLAERKRMQMDVNAGHVDLDELTSSDGFFAIISQKKFKGMFVFSIWRIFERDDGTKQRTSFIPEDKGESYVKFTRLVLERIGKIRASGEFPFKEDSARA